MKNNKDKCFEIGDMHYDSTTRTAYVLTEINDENLKWEIAATDWKITEEAFLGNPDKFHKNCKIIDISDK
jgi:hypothetical protein